MNARLRFHLSLAAATVFSAQTYGPSILWHPSIALASFVALTLASWMLADQLTESAGVRRRAFRTTAV